MRKHHGTKDKATVGSSEGSFTDKIFQVTNELIPSVQRSRINLHRGDSSQESIRALNERRSVLFSEWGTKFHSFCFIEFSNFFLFRCQRQMWEENFAGIGSRKLKPAA